MILKLTAEKRKSRSFSLSKSWHRSLVKNYPLVLQIQSDAEMQPNELLRVSPEILSHARRVQIVPQGQEALPWFAARL